MPKSSNLLDIQLDPFSAIKKTLMRRGHLPMSAVMNSRAKSHKPTEALGEMADRSKEVLFKAETVFPFVLFPDNVILDRMQLSIINRQFFKMAKITSIRVEDILSAEVQVGPFFGSVKIVSRFYSYQMAADTTVVEEQQHAPTINFLWKHDALEIHKLLQGYIVATHSKIDCSNIPKDKLIKTLHELGQNEATAT